MRSKWFIYLSACALLLLSSSALNNPNSIVSASAHLASNVINSTTTSGKSWFFTVSGDSRDCGDLIMPKIAQSIENDHAQAPAEFYWHLGDLRGMFRIDCDMLLRKRPNAKCYTRPEDMGKDELRQYLNDFNDYLKFSWDDFIEHQINPFGQTPFILGIGNHELVNRTREDFRLKFSNWLSQPLIQLQVKADAKHGIKTQANNTFFHFIKNGVDFIYLDNSDNDAAFSPEQLAWLSSVLAADAKDKQVKTIIAGMHAALPQSSERGHAMDATCKGFCSGMQAYEMLYQAQNLNAPANRRKHVYVMASHSHFFRENIYNTPEHTGKVLPGWIIGTGGAEQYISKPTERIMYGYMQVEVHADGTIATQFKEVGRNSAPLATGTGANEITTFCFEQNKRPPSDNHKTDCPCALTK